MKEKETKRTEAEAVEKKTREKLETAQGLLDEALSLETVYVVRRSQKT